MSIAFLTLFFGLISGPYPVELTVDGPAAAVEIQVDGGTATRIPGPPWKATVDFGSDLLPHEIVARALDARGGELARTAEWVNLPQPLAKVEIALEGGGGGPPKAASVVWRNLAGDDLRAVSLAFDGLPVKLDEGRRGLLPAHDLKSVHVLTAEVDFKPDRSVRREVAYGGEYGSEVSTELTGVPVHSRSRLPAPAQLGGWLTAEGKPLAVDAVEEGPGKLYVVVAATGFELAGMGRKGSLPRGRDLHYEMRLGREDQVHLLPARPQRIASGGETSDLFPISPPFTYAQGGLPWFLLHDPVATSPNPRIADAVASAGLAAMDGNRRRAVLLVLAGSETDASRYDAARVRRFLATLRVPLFVWSLGDPPPGSTAAAWGATDVSTTRHLYAEVSRIADELDSQRILMVDGRYLPQSIALAPKAAAAGLTLASTP